MVGEHLRAVEGMNMSRMKLKIIREEQEQRDITSSFKLVIIGGAGGSVG